MFFNPMFLPSGRASVTVTKTDNKVDANGVITYTFSACSLGTAAANRKIVVCICAQASGSTGVTSCSVAGSAASELLDIITSVGNLANVAMYQIDLPTGTTGDVVVVFSGAQGSAGITVFAVYGASAAASATQSQVKGSGAANAKAIDCPAGGVIIGYAALTQSGSDPTSATWTNLTESVDQSTGAGERLIQTAASDAFAAAQTALSITVTPTNAEDSGLLLASWGPA